jgi:hypothetical protein
MALGCGVVTEIRVDEEQRAARETPRTPAATAASSHRGDAAPNAQAPS